MNNQPNWLQIKQALKESFINQDFQRYVTTAFAGVDFDNGLEIFRYILEQKLPKHDETLFVLEKLQLYAKGQQNKDILKGLIAGHEPFLKKLFYIKSNQFPAGKTLRWGYDTFFDYLSIPRSNKDLFFAQDVIDGVKTAKNPSTNFASLLPDSTSFGISLHSVFHLRNSDLHNDPSLTARQISEYITHCLNSYLYFAFKYYSELIALIPSNDLIPPTTLTIRNLASLSGGAYNPNIENEVKRDNIIQTIENKLKNLDVLFIEGEEGIGKTTILHQFVAKYPNNCFAYFIDGKDSSTYSNLAILKALCNQIHFVNKENELEEEVSTENYNRSHLDFLNFLIAIMINAIKLNPIQLESVVSYRFNKDL